jgi:deoxyribose-phosphate aldolase
MDLAPFIDHTCLRPDAVAADIDRLCDEALEHGFFSVCVAQVWVARAAERLQGEPVRIGTVAGFPHGNTLAVVKGVEAETALAAGADEIDMVMNLGAFKDGAHDSVAADISLVGDMVHGKRGALLKVILETALLDDAEIVAACGLAERAGADFVKTSTGFAGGGATETAVRLMRRAVGDRLGVKAAGGIRDAATARALVEAGASRIGCSASVAVVTGPSSS